MSSWCRLLKSIKRRDEYFRVLRDYVKRGEFSSDDLECHRPPPFVSFEALFASGMVDQELPHDTPDTIEEVLSVLPLACIVATGIESNERLVHDQCRLKVHGRIFPSHQRARHGTDLRLSGRPQIRYG